MKKILFILALIVSAAGQGGELLKNAGFSKNFAGWVRRGDKGYVLRYENGKAVFSGDKRGFLIQYKLPAAAGQYRGKYTVSGSGQYRLYCEMHGKVDGKRFYRTSGAGILDAPGDGKSETRSFEFVISAGEVAKIQSFAFVISFVNGENLSVSAPSLVYEKSAAAALPAAVNVTSGIGGKWHLVNGSSVAGSGKDQQLTQIGHGQIVRSKLSGIPVKGGKSYRFSCRTYGVSTKDAAGSCAFRMVPVSGNKELLTPVWDDTWQGEKQIKYLEFTIPESSNTLELQFEVRASTTVRFYDFKLDEIPPKVLLSSFVMDEPVYRDTVFSSVPVKKLSGTVTLQGKAVKARAVLEADGVKAAADVDKNGRFSFDSPGKKSRITVEFFDADGKKVSEAFREIRFPAKFHTEVTFDKDNFMLINGKRFFPVVFWELTAVKEPDGLYYAAKRGVNCFILTSRYVKNSAEKLALLDRAHKYGIKVFLQVPGIDDLTADKIEEYKTAFNKMNPAELRNHPAVIGYFLTDEPIWRGVPQNRVVNGYNVIRELDPYRPLWINAAPRNNVAVHSSYAQAADIYGIDIYPYPYPHSQSGMKDKTLTCVGKYTDFCREAVNDRKPVWMALQGFSWNSYRKPDDGSGYPGLNQMRFVWYETLFHGGRAGSIWGTRHIRSQAYYDTLFDLTEEMHKVSGLFTRYDRIERVNSQNPDIIAELMTVGKAQYLIVRNTNEIPRMSQITGDFPAMKQLVPAGKRVVTAGKSQVALEPFEVMIFGSDALPEAAYTLPAADPELDKLNDPFKRVTRMDIGKIRYQGDAGWIWDKDKLQPNARVAVERKFTIVPEKVKSITLYVAIDDGGVCRFNGVELGRLSTTYADMQVFNIDRKLWEKDNRIEIDAFDSGMVPCGVLAEIRIMGTDGKEEVIVSDKLWQCGGKAADVIAKFGKGAWGSRVSYYK
ncbi:MAG: hypothetical protein E7057_10015 [Lentisphaerae bacterium]|nr:hypothetical protein [Lentisphaerota bacterium]